MKKSHAIAFILISSLFSGYFSCAKESSPDAVAVQLIEKAKRDFESEQIVLAKNEAEKILSDAPTLKGQWVYGNMIHQGHLLLGRIALRNGDLESAKRHLLEAGKTPGSPQLDSFGPNMALAEELLSKGERQVVLDYFELCRKFWDGRGTPELNEWALQIRKGELPDFGANLKY